MGIEGNKFSNSMQISWFKIACHQNITRNSCLTKWSSLIFVDNGVFSVMISLFYEYLSGSQCESKGKPSFLISCFKMKISEACGWQNKKPRDFWSPLVIVYRQIVDISRLWLWLFIIDMIIDRVNFWYLV